MLARFEKLRRLPEEQFVQKVSKSDLQALRAGFRESWSKGDLESVVEVAEKVPEVYLKMDNLLMAYVTAAQEKLIAKE